MTIYDNFPALTFRKFQPEILRALDTAFASKDFVILEGPTGVGKTLFAKAIADYSENCHIVTNQKSLQDQYINDYHISTIKGRSNFTCLEDSRQSCSTGPCLTSTFVCENKPIPDREGEFAAHSEKRGDLFWKSHKHCNYWVQKTEGLISPITVHNYSYFLHETNFVGDIGPREFLISDEGHNIEKQLLNFVMTSITAKNIRHIGVDFINYGTDVEKWITWLTLLYDKLIPERLTVLKAMMEDKLMGSSHLAEYDGLISINNKLSFFFEEYHKNPANWIAVPSIERGSIMQVDFKPIFINEYTHKLYFKYGKKNLIMSGTILNAKKMMESLGLSPDETAVITVPSPFPASHQPIYHLNIGRLNAKALNPREPDNIRKNIVNAIDIILDLFPHDKGIIHCQTYNISSLISENTRHKSRILTHKPANRIDILNKHLTSTSPSVICSPSMQEGVDLKDDLSRFQILVKVPYPYLGDPQIKRRMELDQEYYNWLTCLSIVQSKGRSIRTPDDHAITFTLDSNFGYFVSKNSDMLQEFFGQYVQPKVLFTRKYRTQLQAAIGAHPQDTEWAQNMLK